jgi:dTMP kinase
MATGATKTMKHFITFEGIDGSGKSTIAHNVYDQLKTKGYDVVLTVEPTDTKIGQFVKHCIKTKNDPYATAFAFIADRIDHCKQIQHWLNQGKIVLCDRYAESTYAYQGAQLEDDLKKPIPWLQDLSKQRILIPDRTYLFVIEPNLSLSRIRHRTELIPFEQLAFLEKVHHNYLALCKGKRFLKIDATDTIENITAQCIKDILA